MKHGKPSVFDIAVVVGVLAIVVGILLPAMTPRTHHHGGRQLKDATQVRAIQAALIIWANEHHDAAPPEDVRGVK